MSSEYKTILVRTATDYDTREVLMGKSMAERIIPPAATCEYVDAALADIGAGWELFGVVPALPANECVMLIFKRDAPVAVLALRPRKKVGAANGNT